MGQYFIIDGAEKNQLKTQKNIKPKKEGKL